MRKIQLSTFVFLVAIASVSFVLAGGQEQERTELAANDVELLISTDKENYLPGEPVLISCRFLNRSRNEIEFYIGTAMPGEWLNLWVAQTGYEPEKYVGPDEGVRDRKHNATVILKPGESYQSEAVILWNRKVETSHLSAEAARQVSAGLINEAYALSKPGSYFVKAVYQLPKLRQTVESNPVTINIVQPENGDLAIWDVIKVEGDYGYFLQTGTLQESITSQKTKLITEKLERLAAKYPDSGYNKSIGKILAKHREKLEKHKSKVKDIQE